MGQKKITELQLISSLVDAVMFPVDNAVQTYRATFAQVKTLLYGDAAQITGKTEKIVTIPADDLVMIYDNAGTALKKAKLARCSTSLPRVLGADCKNNAGTPNTQFDLDCDGVTVFDSNLNALHVHNPGAALTNNVSTAGPAAGGRDAAGAFGAASWIHMYWIYNPTTSTLSTISSATAPPTGPTLPSGYTHWAYAGPVRFNGSSQIVPTRIKGSNVYYDTVQQILSNVNPTTETTVSVANFVPPNALSAFYNIFTYNVSANAGVHGYFYIMNATSTLAAQNVIGVQVNSQSAAGMNDVEVPNVGQSIIYKQDRNTISSNLYIKGYKVANGGE